MEYDEEQGPGPPGTDQEAYAQAAPDQFSIGSDQNTSHQYSQHSDSYPQSDNYPHGPQGYPLGSNNYPAGSGRYEAGNWGEDPYYHSRHGGSESESSEEGDPLDPNYVRKSTFTFPLKNQRGDFLFVFCVFLFTF
jgi:hypothetical protein